MRSRRHSIAPFQTVCVRWGTDTELQAELGSSGQHGGIPTMESLAQNDTQLAMYRTRGVAILQANAVGRVSDEQAFDSGGGVRAGAVCIAASVGPCAPRRRRVGQRAHIELHEPLHPRALRIGASIAYRARIPILPPHDELGRVARTSTCARLLQQLTPGSRVMPRPPEKSKVIPAQPRRAIGRNERRLDHERPRPTHGDRETHNPSFNQVRPPRTPAATFSFSGASPAAPPITSPVQALTRQIERDRKSWIRRHAHGCARSAARARRSGRQRPLVTERVDDRVFQFERAEMCVSDRRVLPVKSHAMVAPGPIWADQSIPRNAVYKPLRVGHVEPRQLEINPVRQPRPETSTIRRSPMSRKR